MCVCGGGGEKVLTVRLATVSLCPRRHLAPPPARQTQSVTPSLAPRVHRLSMGGVAPGRPDRRRRRSQRFGPPTPALAQRPALTLGGTRPASGCSGGAVAGGEGAARGGREGHQEDPTGGGGGPRGLVPRPRRWLGDLAQPSVPLPHGPRAAGRRWRAVEGPPGGGKGGAHGGPDRRRRWTPGFGPPTSAMARRPGPTLSPTPPRS